MTSHLGKKSLIYILEFMGLYTLIFIIIGIVVRVSPEILGNKEYFEIERKKVLAADMGCFQFYLNFNGLSKYF